MSLLRDPKSVAHECGLKLDAVAEALPGIISTIETFQKQYPDKYILQPEFVVAVIATAATECGMRPVPEAYYLKPNVRIAFYNKTKYGRINPKTGQRYYGRGYIQLTWDYNYEKYGAALGLNLLQHPDLALQPDVAAKILVLYLLWHGVPEICQELSETTDKNVRYKLWRSIRVKVNGVNKNTGEPNGLSTFMADVEKLMALYERSKGQ